MYLEVLRRGLGAARRVRRSAINFSIVSQGWRKPGVGGSRWAGTCHGVGHANIRFW